MGEKRNAYRVLVEKPERKRPLGRTRLCRKIILKCILDKHDRVVWKEFMWLRIGTRGGL
jgi:hypothetical protein